MAHVLKVLLALWGVFLTGDYPGADVVGIEEDHVAVITVLNLHETAVAGKL